jgi:hypothetical protein
MMTDKFRVKVTNGPFQDPWPKYFDNFWIHCREISEANGWSPSTVANYQLKPYGRLIQTKTQGWYLRWNEEKYHTLFVLRWL